jgi:hypothetical protein
LTTQDGTATAGMDYTPQAGRLVFHKVRVRVRVS